MTSADEMLRRKIGAWLSHMEGLLAKAEPIRPPQIEKLARSFSDPAAVDWVLSRGDPATIRRDVGNVRLYFEIGDLVEAQTIIDRFEIERRHIEGLLQRPYLVTGRKIRDRPEKGGRPELPRDKQMAEEFNAKVGDARLSPTALKIKIGRAHGLSRSGAIKAIDRGIKKLSTKGAKVDK